MWMGIEAWDHKKQAQKISRAILSKAKGSCNSSRMHSAGKESSLCSLLPQRTNTVNSESP